MILHSYRRQEPSYSQLFRYLSDNGRIAGPLLCHNLPPSVLPRAPEHSGRPDNPGQPLSEQNPDRTPDLQPIIDAFLANARLCPRRKNGVALYHEIISLSPKDKALVTPEILLDLAEHYLSLRAPGGMACGVIHDDRENPHIHLVISANLPGRSRKVRLSKHRFQFIKRELEARQRELYPELIHSRVDHDQSPERKRKERQASRKPFLTHNEHQRKKRLERQGKHEPTRKERLSGFLRDALAAADTPGHLEASLRRRGITIYHRADQTEGVIAGGKKYRFRTLGLLPDLDQARKRWERFARNRRLLDDAYAEKYRRLFRREYGYHRDIEAALRRPSGRDNNQDNNKERRERENRGHEDREQEKAAGRGKEAYAVPRAPDAAERLGVLLTEKRRRSRENPSGLSRDR